MYLSLTLQRNVSWDSIKVMELGAGTGILSLAMAAKAQHVVAMDPSQDMIAKLNEKKVSVMSSLCISSIIHRDDCEQESKKIANLTAVASALESESQLEAEQFDVIVLSLTLHHIQDINTVTQLLARALKPKGLLFIYDFKKQEGSDQFHKHVDEKV